MDTLPAVNGYAVGLLRHQKEKQLTNPPRESMIIYVLRTSSMVRQSRGLWMISNMPPLLLSFHVLEWEPNCRLIYFNSVSVLLLRFTNKEAIFLDAKTAQTHWPRGDTDTGKPSNHPALGCRTSTKMMVKTCLGSAEVAEEKLRLLAPFWFKEVEVLGLCRCSLTSPPTCRRSGSAM